MHALIAAGADRKIRLTDMNMLRVFNIQRLSLHDGPGIRTTVFLKGCSLRCRWCHNPESQQPEKEILWDEKKCIACRDCTSICPVHGSAIGRPAGKACRRCGTCADICPSGALELAGKDLPVEAVVSDVLRDRKLFETSGGGVTFSGGEPLLQAEAAAQAAERLCSSGISVAVDTAGYVSWSSFEKVLPFTEWFLFDLKLMDPDKHYACTGADNQMILEHLARLSFLKKVIVRIPLIDGVNTDEADRMGAFLSEKCHIQRVELLKYHTVGKEKYKKLGRAFEEFRVPDDDTVAAFRDTLVHYGLNTVF